MGKLEGLAKPVLPSLYETLQRKEERSNPGFEITVDNFERIKQGHREEIQRAIDALEE